MPIFAPGRRDRHNRQRHGKGRSIVAMLSLTAMVDMFTVLAVFLLQNYNTTGEVIDISDKVELPKASAVKELKPAHVIVVSRVALLIDKDQLMTREQLTAQTEWKIDPLLQRLQGEFQRSETQRKSAPLNALKAADVDADKKRSEDERRITVQADKTVDFLTIKKVMFTITESGASEINFAVIKDEKASPTM
jgi:biopolymer transport protein ExbD